MLRERRVAAVLLGRHSPRSPQFRRTAGPKALAQPRLCRPRSARCPRGDRPALTPSRQRSAGPRYLVQLDAEFIQDNAEEVRRVPDVPACLPGTNGSRFQAGGRHPTASPSSAATEQRCDRGATGCGRGGAKAWALRRGASLEACNGTAAPAEPVRAERFGVIEPGGRGARSGPGTLGGLGRLPRWRRRGYRRLLRTWPTAASAAGRPAPRGCDAAKPIPDYASWSPFRRGEAQEPPLGGANGLPRWMCGTTPSRMICACGCRRRLW